MATHRNTKAPIVLHIGDPIRYNPSTYAAFSSAFHVVRPATAERQRPEFIAALRERRWGDFSAVFRPFWSTGGEMGRWDAELVALLPRSCRVFASAGAGFDWVDTMALGDRDAEAAFLFSHEHTVHHSHNPRGHVLGLIGLGNIGQQVASKLGNASMGMVVHYHDVVRKLSPAQERRLGVTTFHDTLRGLMGASDCVVVCTPASPDGKPLLTGESLGWMRRGARLVNVARGSLVDEEALADALEEGRVSAAALDVHADEPRVSRRLLRFAGLDVVSAAARGGEVVGGGKGVNPGRVMLTCHNAGGTVETHVGFEELAMRNIMAVLGGKDAITPVNLHFLKKSNTKL
ncbi:hypothetical protein SLS53_005044 [Cytospora paraplurivora]|uniref:D-isomer specific 2-hydroxyacid dehydrogenase NAD-binding domain-containing protein n=1 Tax=Cytospora paraplurivora TaxID=2898453 RepID=A0AAN9YFN5_9PEZI